MAAGTKTIKRGYKPMATFHVPVKSLHYAAEAWRAREIDPTRIKPLKDSLEQKVNPTMILMGVYFYGEEGMPETETFEIDAALKKGIYLLTGNHRRRAIMELLKVGIVRDDLEFVTISILACKDTRANHVRLRHLGAWHNKTEHMVIAVTFRDRMFGMRQDWESIRKLQPKPLRERSKELVSTYLMLWPLKRSRVYICWQLARSSDQIWEFLRAYLEGGLVVKKNNLPVAEADLPIWWNNILQMINLPEEIQIRYLTALFSKSITLQGGLEWLTREKARLLVERFLMENTALTHNMKAGFTYMDLKVAHRELCGSKQLKAMEDEVVHLQLAFRKNQKHIAVPKKISTMIEAYLKGQVVKRHRIEVCFLFSFDFWNIFIVVCFFQIFFAFESTSRLDSFLFSVLSTSRLDEQIFSFLLRLIDFVCLLVY